MPIEKVDKIWMNGELVDWDDATIHVLTHTLHYGNGVFEGIQCIGDGEWFGNHHHAIDPSFSGKIDELRIYNRALSAVEVAQLNALEKPPVINTQPQSQTITTGSNVTLSADVNGTGLNYQWYRNGAAITGATNANFTISKYCHPDIVIRHT